MDWDNTPTPIHALDPSSAPEPTATLRAVVSLTWPYSSSSHSSALLLADPDFRLRSRRGQVRVRFTGACADSLATVGLQIGDTVLLGLKGARWGGIGDGVVRTPGKSVEAELIFSSTLRLRAYGKAEGLERESKDVIVDGDDDVRQEKNNEVVNMNAPAARPSTNGHAGPLTTTPAPKRKLGVENLMQNETEDVLYKSPAFGKRLRLSGDEAWLDSMYDPFNDDTSAKDLERPAKRQKVSFGGVRWRLAKNSPSPPPAEQGKEPSGDAMDDTELSRWQGNGSRVSSENSQPIVSKHREGGVQNLGIPFETDSPLVPKSLHTPGLLRTDMLPPPLPGLRPSTSDQIDSLATNDLSEDGPITPRLNPVDTSTLPLPSPFPVEGTQFPFSTTSATFDNSANPQTSVTASMLSTTNTSLQRLAPTGQPMISAQASQHASTGGNDHRQPAENDTDPLADDASSEGSVGKEPDDEYANEESVHMNQMHESDVEEVIEVSDGDEPPDSESEPIDEDVRTDDDADSRRHSSVSGVPTAMAQHIPPLEMRTSVDETGETLNDTTISTPNKAAPLNLATSFGPDGPSSAPSSEHVTPQSGKEKVMARTLSSLFGFKGSADETTAADSENIAMVEPGSPTPLAAASKENLSRDFASTDVVPAELEEPRIQYPDLPLHTPTAAPAAQPKDIREAIPEANTHVVSGVRHTIPEAFEAPHRRSEAASQIQGDEVKSGRDPSAGTLGSHMYLVTSGSTIDDQIDAQFIDDSYSGDGMLPNNTQGQDSNDRLSLAQYDGAAADIPDPVDIFEGQFDSMSSASRATTANLGDNNAQDSSKPIGYGGGTEDLQGDAPGLSAEHRSQSEVASPLFAKNEMPVSGAGLAIETMHSNAAPDSYFEIEDIINDVPVPNLDDSAGLEHILPLGEATVTDAEPLRSHEADPGPARDEQVPTMPKSSFQDTEVIELGSSSSEDPDDTANDGNFGTNEIARKTNIAGAESLHQDHEARDGMGMLGKAQLHSASELDLAAKRHFPASQEAAQLHQRPVQTPFYSDRPLSPSVTQSFSDELAQTDAAGGDQKTEQGTHAMPPTPRPTQTTSIPLLEDDIMSATSQKMEMSEPMFASQVDFLQTTFDTSMRAPRQDDLERETGTDLSLIAEDRQETNAPEMGMEEDGQIASSAPTGARLFGDALETQQIESVTTRSQQKTERELQTSDQAMTARNEEEAEDKEAPLGTQKKLSLRKAKNSRLSFVPDVVKEWFSPRRSSRLAKAETSGADESQTIDRIKTDTAPVDEGMTLRNGHKLGQEGSPDKSATTGFSTPLAYFAPLQSLSLLVNSSSQQAGSRTVDVFAVVTDTTKEPQRAKGGPKDFFTIFRIADQSLGAESSVRVEVFRPWMATLPIAKTGDVVLLRGFLVKSRRRLPYLISTESSAWCVWRYEENGDDVESNAKKPAWARRRGAVDTGTVREEIKGPPVEFGKEEKQHAGFLRDWWLSLNMGAKNEEKGE